MKIVNTEFKRMQKKESISGFKQMHSACFSSLIYSTDFQKALKH